MICASTPLHADEAGASLSLDLNTAENVDGACRLTFMVENTLTHDLTALAYETVVITTAGEVERLTIFDFGAVPAGRPRVRQFDLTGISCDTIGRLLINGASACAGATPDACIDALKLESRTKQELVG